MGEKTPVSGSPTPGRLRGDDSDAGGPVAPGPQEGAGGTREGANTTPTGFLRALMYDYESLDSDIQALIRSRFAGF